MQSTRWLLLCAMVSAAGVTLLAASARQSTAEDVGAFVRALQAKYDTTREFSASFVHTYEGGALRRKNVEHGQVVVKKPGRMRWTYTKPEPKTFVSDGVRMYAYVPADRQVIVSRLPADNDVTAPIMFLIGKGDLARDFTAAWPPEADVPAGTKAVRLTPKQRQPEYSWILLAVEPETLQLRVLQSLDSQGGTSTFTFSNMKVNPGIDDKVFDFAIPRGADVITQ